MEEPLQVTNNSQRLRRHDFAAVETQLIRVTFQAANGDWLARLFEVRADT